LSSLNAQYDGPILIFQGKISDVSGKKLDGVQIIVKKDGQPFKQSKSSSNGKYQDIEAPFGHIYEITFKMEGYVSKVVQIDAKKGYYEDDTEPETYMKAETSLFKAQKNVDYSIVENKPVGKARIDPSTGKMAYNEVYINQRKNEISRYLKQVAQKARQQEELFNKMVSEGDLAYNKEDYEIAILKYKEALKIKDDSSLEQKILDAQKNLSLQADQKENRKQYDALILKGDNLLNSNSFDDAILSYNEAKDLLPGVQIAYDKIRAANQMKEDLANAEIDKNYQEKMQKAKKAFDNKDWDQAKSYYNEASQVKPNERAPKDRINEIDNLLAKMKRDEENYKTFISQGDQNLLEKDFDKSIKAFQDALAIKPNESYPKEQIKKANEMKLAAEAASKLNQKYNNIITRSDDLFKKLSYELAKSSYQEALALKPDEKYPNDQISIIDKKLKEIADQVAKDLENQKLYEQSILQADKIFNEKKWDDAKLAYEEAKKIKPNEVYPQQKIDEINIILQRIAAEDAEKQKRYDALISNADAYFKSDNWEESKKYYNDALAIFSDKTYPKDQIILIDQKIADAEKEQQNNLIKLKEFESLISEGDKNVKSLTYSTAKEKYLAAKKLFPDKIIVDQKLSNLEKLIKDQQFKNSIDSTYNATILKADQLRDSKSWKESKEKYYEAINIKPVETYPKSQIDFINSKINDEQINAAKKSYDDLIVKADDAFDKKSYEEAIDFYNKAKLIIPSEIYPVDKIRDIRRILYENEAKENKYKIFINTADNEFESQKWEFALINYESALALFDREYPNKKIIEIKEKLKALKTQNEELTQKRLNYDKLIIEADNLYKSKNLEDAKSKYEEALNIFEKEIYPKQKISEINLKLQSNNLSSELNDKYNKLISDADALRDQKQWDEAKKLYLEANSINSIPNYPKEQIDFINGKMKEETEKEFKLQYDKLITAADNQFNQKNYDKAIELYKRAKAMNPKDLYPNSKLNQIDRILKDIEKNKQDELRFKANQEKYNQLISQADAAKASKQWLKAKELFKKAANVLPSESYPQQQIDDINIKMKQSALDDIQKQYDKIIAQADNFYKDKNYNRAIEYYRRAQTIRPSDSYPPEQIRKLEKEKMLSLNKEKDEKLYSNYISSAKRSFQSKNYRSALKKYQSALKLKPEAKYPIEQIKAINNILDNKSSDNSGDLSKNNVTDYQTLYGDEVTGKYSEDQINQLINKVRLDDDYFYQQQMKDRKEYLFDQTKKTSDFQIDLNNKQTKNFDLLAISLYEKNRKFNEPRLNLINQFNRYKLQNYSLMDIKIRQNNEQLFNNLQSKNRMKDIYSTISLKEDVYRASRNESVSLFLNQKNSIEFEQNQKFILRSYENTISNQRFLDNVSDVVFLTENNRNMNSQKINFFQENLSLENEKVIKHYNLISYNNYNSKDAFVSRISQLSSNFDLKRQDEIIPYFGYYEETNSSKKVLQQKNQLIKNYSEYVSKESYNNRLSDLARIDDLKRDTNSMKFKNFIESESYKLNVWNELNTDKIQNVNVINEMINNEVESKTVDQDILRSINTAEFSAYKEESLTNASENAYEKNKDLFANANEIEKLKNSTKTENYDGKEISEKIFERKNARGVVFEVTIIRIVEIGDKKDEYKKVTSRHSVNHFKNGALISEYIWDTETNN
tara:strand:+ start:897 stop:5894 length:4998 start_codon:yes stop_codon:yes gene_type:complete